MTGSAACRHGMPSPASCLDCMDETGLGAAPERRERVNGSRPARYESRCPVCDGDIEIGSTIWHTTEERWVCGACADHQPREVWA